MKTIKPLEISKEILNKFKPVIKDNNGRIQYDFFKVVNYDKDTKEITVLDYAFNDNLHNKPFNGCTGTKFLPVTKAEYKERTSKENVIDYLYDSGLELPKEHLRGGWNSVYKAMKANNEIESFIFDTSYRELWDYLRKELKLNKTEAYIFECVGGGRCFDKGYKGNINPELSEVINTFEG